MVRKCFIVSFYQPKACHAGFRRKSRFVRAMPLQDAFGMAAQIAKCRAHSTFIFTLTKSLVRGAMASAVAARMT
jgi:hypothetical protein